jgi:hypothetical protein
MWTLDFNFPNLSAGAVLPWLPTGLFWRSKPSETSIKADIMTNSLLASG